ncbi:MAG: 2-hydroxyhepta-2,4-diene-1,7-dioate isomerase [Flavobacteriales bacterium]|nr:2-hydroxyhepta-2,4-diene-1,7-dioate isomerase [Flavobacteriales bacterium]
MKIICIGRNYYEHAKELGNETPKEPVFFMKPDTAISPKGHPFFIPEFSKNVQYEVELVIRINRLGKYIEEKFAHKYYEQIGLGIDFTARDIQQELKEKGLPWEKAKGFDGSAVISKKYLDKKELELADLNFSLKKNGEMVQSGNTQQMLFKIDQIIAYISQFYTLKIGDLIYTGTPAGVGQVNPGDVLEGFIEEQKMFEVKVR